MMKFFTAYKVQFSRKELGINGDDFLGNPLLTDRRRKNRYRMGSHISEEDSFYSSDDSGDSVADIFGLIDLPEYRKPTGNTRPRSDSIFGPTTESLVPVVSFTSQYDALIMNGQR